MFAKGAKLYMILILLLVLLLCSTGGLALAISYQQKYGCYNDRPPLRSLSVIIETSQSQQLIEQLEKFADKNGFTYDLTYYSPDADKFSFWMERKDLEVIARSPFTRGEFKIGFYNNDCANPTIASDITNVVNDLISHLREIPGVAISEQQ